MIRIRAVLQRDLAADWGEGLEIDFETPVQEDRAFRLEVMRTQPEMFSRAEWRSLAGFAATDDEAFNTNRFNPLQPRVPAGNPGAGRWTDGDGGVTFFQGRRPRPSGGPPEQPTGQPRQPSNQPQPPTHRDRQNSYVDPQPELRRVLERSTPDKADAKQFIYDRGGTARDLTNDFNAIVQGSRVTEVQTADGILRRATLPDGRTVIAREFSSAGPPTLEIQVPTGHPNHTLPQTIEVRYR